MEEIKKTGYEWSLESNHRLINISEYNLLTEDALQIEDDYFTKACTKSEYLDAIEYAKIKENSTPRKTENYLEWRMYGLVPK